MRSVAPVQPQDTADLTKPPSRDSESVSLSEFYSQQVDVKPQRVQGRREEEALSQQIVTEGQTGFLG